MTSKSLCAALVLATAFSATSLVAADSIPLHNWPVPSASGGRSALTETDPVAFISVTPCRIVDTRGGAPLGGGILVANTVRNYTLSGQCGIPVGVTAVSLNVVVTNTQGAGDLRLYPQGGAAPLVSTINFVVNQTLANAAIVPLSASGGLSVLPDVSGTDLIIDTNGYFSDTPNPGTAGFHIFVNTGNYSIYAINSSTTCGGSCGIYSSVSTLTGSTNAIFGNSSGTTNNNYGVLGAASGTGGTYPPLASAYSAGVYGRALVGSGNVAGVMGTTASSGGAADGVLGIASLSAANGGQFYNSASSTNVYLAYGSTGVNTNGGIMGATLSISGAKAFIAPHPEDPTKEIKYISVEAPTADVYFRGTARLVGGVATIAVPDHFRFTSRDDSYMTTVTAVGGRGTFYVESEGPDGIVVRGTGDGSFHYVVYAERDVMRDHQAVQANVDFTPEILAKTDSMRTMPERMRTLLVRNGTVNADGSFNEATARRIGWSLPAPAVSPAPVPVTPGKD